MILINLSSTDGLLKSKSIWSALKVRHKKSDFPKRIFAPNQFNHKNVTLYVMNFTAARKNKFKKKGKHFEASFWCTGSGRLRALHALAGHWQPCTRLARCLRRRWSRNLAGRAPQPHRAQGVGPSRSDLTHSRQDSAALRQSVWRQVLSCFVLFRKKIWETWERVAGSQEKP